MSEKKESSFFKTISRSTLVMNQTSAGAGFTGLLGFSALFIIASIFFITENYFIAMFTISVGLLVYVTGMEITKILFSSFTIFFSSRHLIPNAAYIQDTLTHLKRSLQLQRDKKGEINNAPIAAGAVITLPSNALVKDLQQLAENDKEYEYSEYVAHSYYVECHELYSYARENLEFVAGSMPLFGLIGTIVGLIAMFDNLGGDVTVEALSPQLALALKTTLYGAIFSSLYTIIASRFSQRLKSLDYDYEIFCRCLKVMADNKVKIQVQQ